jgi:hypothetical protein
MAITSQDADKFRLKHAEAVLFGLPPITSAADAVQASGALVAAALSTHTWLKLVCLIGRRPMSPRVLRVT